MKIRRDSIYTVILGISCLFVIYLAFGAEKFSPKYISHPDESFVNDEFRNVYNSIFRIKSSKFSWDVPSTLTGAQTSTTFTLPENGIVVGVELPKTGNSTDFFSVGGDSGNGGRESVSRANGNTAVLVIYTNNTGGTVDPPSTPFRVFYIKT